MANDPTNGGRRIGKLEQKDAVQDVLISELVASVKETNVMLRQLIPEMARYDERINSNRTWIKSLWGIAGALLVFGVKAALGKHNHSPLRLGWG